MNLKETYNKIAEDWVKDHNDDTWWQEGTEYFLSLLPRGSRVLDVGCGGGIKTRYISDMGYEVIGIDFSEKMIEIARRENPGINFEVIDIYNVDKVPGTFDGIFAQAVLLHIPKSDTMKVLTALKDKLNINGLLYIATKEIRQNGVEEDVRTENDYGYDYSRFFSYFSPEQLKEYFKELELEVVWVKDSVSTTDTGWIQIIGKKTR